MLLTKSKYMVGLKCKRHFWMEMNQKDKLPEHPEEALYFMNQGNVVGKLAQKLFPDGTMVSDSVEEFMKNIEDTKKLIEKKKTIFEAGVMSGDLYSRVDVLRPNGDGWDLIEVKASTRVKSEYLDDVAFQKYVCEKFGIKIKKCFLMHMNRNYVRKDELDIEKLFIIEDITDDIEKVYNVEKNILELLLIASEKEPPDVNINKGCENKFECRSKECWEFLPEGNVYNLYRAGKLSDELFNSGICLISEVPDEKLSEKQLIQKMAASGKSYIDKEGIRKFLQKLKHPVHYMDFETVQTAIPVFKNTKTWQQVPFQFSVHVEDGNELKHFEFLNPDSEDPRRKFIEKLRQSIGDEGSVVVFYERFEIGRLHEIADEFPEHREWIDKLIPRIVDLIEPFRSFHYYSSKQKGSCSIKNILPSITDNNYENLNINNGQLAAAAYFENMIQKSEKDVQKDLLEYCEMDTKAMVWIVEELKKLSDDI